MELEQKKGERRASYLIRVVHAFMNETYAGNESLFYDDAECDGLCLADDVDAAITYLMAERDDLLAALKETKATLERENCGEGASETPSICDTIWHSKYETLFDFIDAAIEKAELSK